MKKYLLIDKRMRKIEKDKLKSLGYELIQMPNCSSVYYEISSHVDIFCTKIKDRLIFEKLAFDNLESDNDRKVLLENGVIIGKDVVGSSYPFDILYNVCNIGDFVIHKFKYTSVEILKLIDKLKLKKIDVNQGYTKCSIAVIDDNSAITSDKKIANSLIKYGIDTLLIEDINNIKLLGKDGSYSNMNGFIGGAVSRIDDKVFISGDLSKIDKNYKIRNFIKKRNLEIIDFSNLDVIDYGSIVKV